MYFLLKNNHKKFSPKLDPKISFQNLSKIIWPEFGTNLLTFFQQNYLIGEHESNSS